VKTTSRFAPSVIGHRERDAILALFSFRKTKRIAIRLFCARAPFLVWFFFNRSGTPPEVRQTTAVSFTSSRRSPAFSIVRIRNPSIYTGNEFRYLIYNLTSPDNVSARRTVFYFLCKYFSYVGIEFRIALRHGPKTLRRYIIRSAIIRTIFQSRGLNVRVAPSFDYSSVVRQ